MSPSRSYPLHFTAPSRHAGENSSPSFLSNSTIANIVGYQNKELNENANAFVAQTLIPCGVTAADVTLDDFVPTSGADGWDYTSDFLATLKTNGNLDKKYGYLSPYWAAKYWTADEAGWYDYSLLSEEEQTASDAIKGDSVQFAPGAGFLVYTAGSDIELVLPSPL